MEKSIDNTLIVLWTSPDREVALKMAFMYTYNSKIKGWWDEVTLIVWGPSAKLLTEDAELQDYLKRIQSVGIEVVACKACTDSYGITEKLQDFGIDVKYMGQPLTHLLKAGYKILNV